MNTQNCLLFIIALPVIIVLFVFIGLPLLALSFGALSSLIREILLPSVCILAAITIIGFTNYIITSRKHKKMEREKEKETAIIIEKDKARFESLSTPEEYIAYYEEKLQEQRVDLQRAKNDGLQVGKDPYIRYLYEKINDTNIAIRKYKNIKKNTEKTNEV